MKDNSLKVIFDSCHSVAINMNDTFYYACADSACIDIGELEDLEPVIELYGWWAFVAYEALKRGHDPQIPRKAENPKFIEAKKLILDLISTADKYGPFYELRNYLEETKRKTIKEQKRISRFRSKLKEWYSFFY